MHLLLNKHCYRKTRLSTDVIDVFLWQQQQIQDCGIRLDCNETIHTVVVSYAILDYNKYMILPECTFIVSLTSHSSFMGYAHTQKDSNKNCKQQNHYKTKTEYHYQLVREHAVCACKGNLIFTLEYHQYLI